MSGKKKTPFATDKDATALYVKARCSGIHQLVILCDGLTLTFFGREKQAYLLVSDAIAWHEKELRDSRGQSGSRIALALLRKAQQDFDAGLAV